jgi:hypothetical protein
MRLTQLNPTTFVFVILLILLPLAAFWPGTSGDFLLDDHPNLERLEDHGGVKDLDTLRMFVFDGIAGPTGRPVSLLSFLIDGQTWPTDPYPFKRTNILIHAFNGVLIFAIVLQLLQLIGRARSEALFIAFVSAAIWLIHPLHVSTVLYVIQRMTELVAFFTLIGIWCYLHGREKLLSAPGPGYLWMSTGVLVFGLLATLSKENGVLLPVYILAIEFTLLRQTNLPDHWRYWAIPMLGVPFLAILAYLGYVIDNHTTEFISRDFTLYERLLSEPRILFDYLGKIVFPAHTPSLYFDDFRKSTSLFSPFTTPISLLLLMAGIIASFVYNKRFPVLSFATLWFLGGHLLESTVLPLELYFEHRNYLPMLGISIAIAYYAEKLIPDKKVYLGGSTLVVFILAATSWHHSGIWGDNERLFTMLAEKHPDSARAQIGYTIQTFKSGGDEHSMHQLAKTVERFPDSLGITILNTNVMCQLNRLTQEDFAKLLEKANSMRIDSYTKLSFTRLIDDVRDKHCSQLSVNGLLALINTLLRNQVTPPNNSRTATLLLLKAKIYGNAGKLMPALQAMDEAFRFQPSVDLAMQQASLLVNARQLQPGWLQLNKAEAIDRMRSPLLPSRLPEINKVRAMIRSMQK